MLLPFSFNKPMSETKSTAYNAIPVELRETDFAFIYDVMDVNFEPHPFTVGIRCVAHANNNGVLTKEVCDEVGCEYIDPGTHRRCGLKFKDHTYDRVAFIKLKRNCSIAELQVWVNKLESTFDQEKIDGLTFIETPEKFRAE